MEVAQGKDDGAELSLQQTQKSKHIKVMSLVVAAIMLHRTNYTSLSQETGK